MTHEELAEKLCAPLWRGISGDYKKDYKANIWTQFERGLQVAAHTSSLPLFLQTITRKFGGINIREIDLGRINETMKTGEPEKVLTMVRDESAYLIALVREANEAAKPQGSLLDVLKEE